MSDDKKNTDDINANNGGSDIQEEDLPSTPGTDVATVDPSPQATTQPTLDQAAPDAPSVPADIPDSANMPAPVPAPGQAPATPPIPAQVPQAAPEISVLGNVPPAQNLMQRNAQDMAFAQDVSGGAIKPETYQSLFQNQGTLGKIGTLFGLLVSGAGSGLSHQPNMLMDMMNNEINRDLDAQKTNQTNKLNWYNSAAQHEMNLAHIGEINAITNAQNIGAWNSSLAAAHQKWVNEHLEGYVEDAATTGAANRARMIPVQQAYDAAQRLAPGPQQQNAIAAADQMKNAVMQENQANNANYVQRKAAQDQLSPNPVQQAIKDKMDPLTNPVDLQKYRRMLQTGAIVGDQAGALNAITPGEKPIVDQQVANITKSRQAYLYNTSAFKQLQDLGVMAGQSPGGKLISSIGTAVGTGLGAMSGLSAGPVGVIAGAGAGNVAGHTAAEAASIFERQRNIITANLAQMGLTPEEINNRVPSYADFGDPEKIKKVWDNMVQSYKNSPAELSTQNLKDHGLYKPVPYIPYIPSQASATAPSATPNNQPSIFQQALQKLDIGAPQ